MAAWRRHQTKFIQIGLLVLSVIFIAAGVYRNETNTVFGKAVRICLECVGIG